MPRHLIHCAVQRAHQCTLQTAHDYTLQPAHCTLRNINADCNMLHGENYTLYNVQHCALHFALHFALHVCTLHCNLPTKPAYQRTRSSARCKLRSGHCPLHITHSTLQMQLNTALRVNVHKTHLCNITQCCTI
jgi:hypothetical protein